MPRLQPDATSSQTASPSNPPLPLPHQPESRKRRAPSVDVPESESTVPKKKAKKAAAKPNAGASTKTTALVESKSKTVGKDASSDRGATDTQSNIEGQVPSAPAGASLPGTVEKSKTRRKRTATSATDEPVKGSSNINTESGTKGPAKKNLAHMEGGSAMVSAAKGQINGAYCHIILVSSLIFFESRLGRYLQLRLLPAWHFIYYFLAADPSNTSQKKGASRRT